MAVRRLSLVSEIVGYSLVVVHRLLTLVASPVAELVFWDALMGPCEYPHLQASVLNCDPWCVYLSPELGL